MDLYQIFFGLLQIFKLDFEKFILIYNSISPDFIWIVFLVSSFFLILVFLKLFGAVGLYVYTAVAIIAANIQVLKLVKFTFFPDPIALGTILFASTFLCTDILAEYFGPKEAKKNVVIGFSSFMLMTFFMLFTLSFEPLDKLKYLENYNWAIGKHDNLLEIFLPLPTLFAASMIAYLLSQFFDIWFFNKIAKLTFGKFLWLRNNLSTMTSSLIDNTIFSIFAWIIFNPNPIDFYTVLITFIFGNYLLRIAISLIDTPFVYLAKLAIPKK